MDAGAAPQAAGAGPSASEDPTTDQDAARAEMVALLISSQAAAGLIAMQDALHDVEDPEELTTMGGGEDRQPPTGGEKHGDDASLLVLYPRRQLPHRPVHRQGAGMAAARDACACGVWRATTIAVRLLKESTTSQDALNRLQQCARCADARAIVPARPGIRNALLFRPLAICC